MASLSRAPHQPASRANASSRSRPAAARPAANHAACARAARPTPSGRTSISPSIRRWAAACRAPSGWRAERTSTPSRTSRPMPPRRSRRLPAGIERAILSLGDVGRVHLYRWGDGGAHFHVWFLPRPLGMLEAKNHMLPLWEDVLPNVSDEELADAARAGGGRAVTAPAALARRLGTGDAVVIGLGSMIGAGVFAALGPAAAAAGGWPADRPAARRRASRTAMRCPPPSSPRTTRPRAVRTSTAANASAGLGLPGGMGLRDRQDGRCAAMALTFAAYLLPQPGCAAAAGGGRRDRPHGGELPRHHAHRRAGARPGGAVRRGAGAVFVAVAAAATLSGAAAQPATSTGRRLWRAAVGRAAVLRLRRLCPDRDAGRGGPRAGTHHPARHPARVGHHAS